MKRSSIFLLSIVTVATFATSSASSAATRETRRLDAGKITKNEAQHLVLKHNPGARIQNCRLTGAKGHSVWVVDFMAAGSNKATTVRVDGRSGKIMR